MPKNVTQYDLMISCPGDIKEEIEVIEKVVQKFNDQFSDTLGISIRTRHWRKNSYPQSGGKPQALLNEQFVLNCDAAVALFWTRFGTPTDQYDSGTEEEIEIMLDAGKQVFVYFSEKPVPPSEMDNEGYAKVQALKRKYRDRGIYFDYSTVEEFERIFYAHLTQYFLSVKVQPERNSQLVLRGIQEDGFLCENPTVLNFKLNSHQNSQTLFSEIKELYQKIDSMHMGQRILADRDENNQTLLESLASIGDKLFPPVEIEEETKSIIVSVAKMFNISLSDDFFYLGNLSKNASAVTVLGGCSYTGSPEEELKYELIEKLHRTILKFSDWMIIEEAFAGLLCVKLAIENHGTAIDEDVEVELLFKTGGLLPQDKFPTIQDENAIKYLLDTCNLKDLLSISSTAQYKTYENSQRPIFHGGSNSTVHWSYPYLGRDYQQEYRDSIADIYHYEVFNEKDRCIVKIKFDYIKHHTVIAFPTPIFLQEIPSEIEYRITSQNSPDILSGKLLVETIS